MCVVVVEDSTCVGFSMAYTKEKKWNKQIQKPAVIVYCGNQTFDFLFAVFYLIFILF